MAAHSCLKPSGSAHAVRVCLKCKRAPQPFQCNTLKHALILLTLPSKEGAQEEIKHENITKLHNRLVYPVPCLGVPARCGKGLRMVPICSMANTGGPESPPAWPRPPLPVLVGRNPTVCLCLRGCTLPCAGFAWPLVAVGASGTGATLSTEEDSCLAEILFAAWFWSICADLLLPSVAASRRSSRPLILSSKTPMVAHTAPAARIGATVDTLDMPESKSCELFLMARVYQYNLSSMWNRHFFPLDRLNSGQTASSTYYILYLLL